MALKIETFSNVTGGQCLFKAVGHPLAAEKMHTFLKRLRATPEISIYDPRGALGPLSELYDFKDLKIQDFYVQKYEDLGTSFQGVKAKPVVDLRGTETKTLFVVAFDGELLVDHIRHLIPEGCEVVTLDEIRLPNDLLTNTRRYLDPLNFATNFAFFRDENGFHTRVVTANYWSIYNGGKPINLWLRLFDAAGEEIITWREIFKTPGETLILDSQEIKERFELPDFCGQLFIHVVGAAGHDIVKYALDTYSDDGVNLSCTHDANAWPADYYAGLPAPKEEEKVILWVQNSHPTKIPAKGVGIGLMGEEDSKVSWVSDEIPPFASIEINVAELLPGVKWPQQLEIHAGKHFVRPRYEILYGNGKRRIAHANVERTDLAPDPTLKKASGLFGKGFILPAPLLPLSLWKTIALPTPMARTQGHLPLRLGVYDSKGNQVYEAPMGNLARSDSRAINVTDALAEKGVQMTEDFGHVELTYDFDAGEEADGWLHGLFRYETSDHSAETSFGAHIFNTVLTYKDQPKSYSGVAPGLSTRLFLRTGVKNQDTLCHLIYPASTPWHALSDTKLILHSASGEKVAEHHLEIPCGGSHFWRLSETFDGDALKKAGENGYVIIRDTTCRLFGYHGLIEGTRFSFDHMFGF